MNDKDSRLIKNSQKNLIHLDYDALSTSFSNQEALEAIHNYQPDLVLINLESATVSDPELLRSVRAHFNGPILYLVDRDKEQTLQRARIDGPFCFTRNPLQPGDFRRTIELALYKYAIIRHSHDNDERYQIISEMVSDAAFSLTLQPNQVFEADWVSDGFVEIGGYSFEEIGRVDGWRKAIHPEDQAAFLQQIDVLLSGKTVTGEYRFFHKTGRLTWLQFFAQPRFDKTGCTIERIYVALRNITRLKMTKEILYRDQEELRTLFDNAPIGMAITSLDFRLRSINTTLCSMLEYNYRELIGMISSDITDADDFVQERRMFQKLIDGELQNFVMEKSLISRSGNRMHTTMHASLIRDSRGVPLHFITQYVDISQRKLTEQSLEESYVAFSTILNGLDAYVTVIDMETDEILFANQKAVDTFGFIANKKCWQMLQPGQNVPCTFCNNSELMASDESGALFIEENFYPKINAWMEVRSQLIHWVDNRLVRMEIATDITRHKRMEVEMHLLNGSLSESLLSLQERNREMVVLNELSESLQICENTQDAYLAFGKIAEELFNAQPGELLTLDPASRTLGVGCRWGSLIYSIDESTVFSCPALKEKKLMISLSPEDTGICPCVTRSVFKVPFLCAVIDDQNKPFALLHLEYHDNSPLDPLENISVSSTISHSLSLKEWENLATMVASQLSLLLMNIRLKQRLQIEAIRDPLTGLFNRRYMDESLEREFSRAQRHQHPVGVIIIDIDHFKAYNDQFGHKMGDCILKQFGAYFLSHFRGEDTACRFGGDEIVIILPEASLDKTCERAREINRDSHNLIADENCFEQRLTTSIGVAVFPQHGHTFSEVMEAADSALYHAKQNGRDQVVVAQKFRSLL